MLLYFIVALVGVGFLVVSAVLGEVFDFLDGFDGLDDGVHPLSGKVIAAGMTAFGAAGMVASYYDLDAAMTAIIAFLAAAFVGALAWWSINALYRSTASTDVSVATMLGRRGRITVGIPAGSVGEVLISMGGSTRHMIARSRSGEPIPEGSSVDIVETLGSVVVVEPHRDPVAPVSAQQ